MVPTTASGVAGVGVVETQQTLQLEDRERAVDGSIHALGGADLETLAVDLDRLGGLDRDLDPLDLQHRAVLGQPDP